MKKRERSRIKDIYSLTPLQEGMLFYNIQDTNSTSYVVQNVLNIKSNICEEYIKGALKLLAERYEVLKTAVVYHKIQKPRQIILRDRKIEYEKIDLSKLSNVEQEKIVSETVNEDVKRGFNLEKDALIRVKYIKLGRENHKLIWSFHHIIMDGWCLSLILGDFMRYYQQLKSGRNMSEMNKIVDEEKRMTSDYSEYVKWLEKQDKEEGLSYWKELLTDYDEMTEIKPVKKPKPTEKQMERTGIRLTKDVSDRLTRKAASSNVTINTVTEAAWGIVLQKYNHTDDVVFGKIVSGRSADIRGVEAMVGLFINTIPVRVKSKKNMTASELWDELQKQAMKGSSYDYCSLADVQSQTKQGRELIKTLLIFENYYINQEKFKGGNDGLQMEMESAREQTNYPISLCVNLIGGAMNMDIMYNPNEYVKDEIESILARLEKVLNKFAENPDAKISEIELITEEERNIILKDFNDTDMEYPGNKTVVELFEQQVIKTPNNVAVVYEGEELTYAEFNQRVNVLAHKLRKMGVKPNDFVAVMAERSVEMIVGIYGIIKAGGAYVPIDPTYPRERIDYMLNDCKPKAVLTYMADIDTEIPVIDLEDSKVWEGLFENPKKVNIANDLIYVIYTSGTTGKPKGVMNRHNCIVNLITWLQKKYPLNESGAILLKTAYVFDISVSEIFWWSAVGSRLVILQADGEKDPLIIMKTIQDNNVTIVDFAPSVLSMFMSSMGKNKEYINLIRSVEYILACGEALNAELVNITYEIMMGEDIKTKLINLYGPTEASVYASYYKCEPEMEIVPIGKPMGNTKLYIREGENLCGIGIPGELWIAGAGVTNGYLNKPELTAEKFVDNPYGEGKLYCTGDLARWLPDGNIEYLGRIDEQVKIRGFRIELGEIENVLRKQKNITDAAVIVRENKNGEKVLCAYMVSDKELNMSQIKEEFGKKLPEYMIPTYLMQIEKIPVNINGKLDKKCLPEIETKIETEYITPRNEMEETLSQVFGEILRVEKVGIKDSFFQLGGDSIKAIRVVSKMREKGYDITVKDIMNGYTVENIARRVTEADNIEYNQEEVTGTVVSTPIIQAFEAWELEKPNHFNQAFMVRIYTDEEEKIRKVLKALVVHHDILRAVYRNKNLEILSSRESKMYDFYVFDFRGEENLVQKIDEECTKQQRSIDLENGPLMKTALFKTDDGNYLFICLHHLIVDGVSWRILMEDFTTSMRQVKEGEKIEFPRKTASYKEWGEALKEYGNSKKLKSEKKYWEKITTEVTNCGIKADETTNETGFGSILVTLTKDETEKLVNKSGKAFNTEINDMLISALGMAVRKLTGQEKVAVVLEGHGREKINSKIEIDRTVGWFTSIYPIIVECKEDIIESIIQTKEMLRKVPNHGIGYGMLTDVLNKIRIDINFNYMGDMESGRKEEIIDVTMFYPTGRSMAEENWMPGDIKFNGSITQGRLSFVISYDRSIYSSETIKMFADLYKEALKKEILYCISYKGTVKTPSDYSVKDLEMDELSILDKHFEKINSEMEDIFTLTPLQKGMLFHNMEDSESTGYVVQNIFNLKGEIDERKIGQALDLLGKRHSVLRTVIMYQRMIKPRQVVLKRREIEYEKIDLSKLNELEQEKMVAEIASLDIKRGFNLEEDTLIRMKYVKLGREKHRLIWSFHHIIMDGWCLSMISGDFMRYYQQLKSSISMSEMNRMVDEERCRATEYSEYLKWLEKQDKEKGLAYWKEFLTDYEETVEIRPLEKPELTEKQVERIGINLTKDLSHSLIKKAASNNVTINTVIETAWGIVLQKYNHTDDVVFGKVVSGRNADIKGVEEIVGLFINTIPVRVKSEENMTVAELWQRLQKQAAEASSYDYCSLAEVQEQTKQGSDLIKTLFVFENYYVNIEKLKSEEKGLQMQVTSAREQTNYPISVIVSSNGETMNIDIMYNPNKYIKEEIENLLVRLEKVLQEFEINPNARISEIDLVTEEERRLIMREFNDTDTEYPSNNTVVELFEEQVKRTPNSVAVVHGEEKLTYVELNQRANVLAHKLRNMGVKPDDFVAIMADRSIEMIVGIYGTIKAGGAYVPIDPTYPRERKEYILNDCKPKVVLTYMVETDIEIPTIDLGDSKVWEGPTENPKTVNKPDDLIYVIYTSGTTGKPKGVMSRHTGLINRILWMNREYPISEGDVILQKTTYTFDVSVWEIVWWSLVGATVAMLKTGGEKEPDTICDAIEKYGVTVMHFVPSMFGMFQEYLKVNFKEIEKINSLRWIFTSGEALKVEHVKKFNEIIKRNNECLRLINFYGPTEASIDVTYYNCGEVEEFIPIGKPIANTQIYILNNKKLCGIGMPGELCIAGVGLARGYLNRPELTKEKFIDNPYREGKLYRTGDLARWMTDGNIQYLGRIDEQVKIRGYRIELGEIESVMLKQEHVIDAAVIAREDKSGEKVLCAYVVSRQKINVSEIREELGKKLPEYMIPTYIMQIEKIPVTKNGKLDKKALPKIKIKTENEFVAPRNEIEKCLCSVFESVLEVEKIGIKDNFFEIGGNSIKAIEVISKMRKNNYELTVKDLITYATPERISKRLSVGALDISVQRINSIIELDKLYIGKPEKFNLDDELLKYQDNMNSASMIRKYEPLKLQEHFLKVENSICPSIIQIRGNVTQEQINNALKKLIGEQGVLRSAYIKKENIIAELDMGKWYIPFVEEEKDKLTENDCFKMCIKQGEYADKELLSKVIVFKKSNNVYNVHFYVHHSLWDQMSYEILIDRIKYYLGILEDEKLTENFVDYVVSKQSNTIPLEVDRIINEFEESANKYREFYYNKGGMKYTAKIEMPINNEEQNKFMENPINSLLAIHNKLYDVEFSVNTIPFIMLYHGRKSKYNKTLGMFLDMLPGIYNITNDKITGGNEIFGKNIQGTVNFELLYERYCDIMKYHLPSVLTINYGGLFSEVKEIEKIKEIKSCNIYVMQGKFSIKGFVNENAMNLWMPAFGNVKEDVEKLFRNFFEKYK